MSTDPITLAREVVRQHGHLDRDALSRREKERLDLALAVIAVADLHEPIRVYNECEDPECPNEHIELYDYHGCEATALGWACPICCYDDERPLECCEHGGDHTGVPQDQACSTRAALNGDNK